MHTPCANFGGTYADEPSSPSSTHQMRLGKRGTNGCDRYERSLRFSVMHYSEDLTLIRCLRDWEGSSQTSFSSSPAAPIDHPTPNSTSPSSSRDFFILPVTSCSRNGWCITHSNSSSSKPQSSPSKTSSFTSRNACFVREKSNSNQEKLMSLGRKQLLGSLVTAG